MELTIKANGKKYKLNEVEASELLQRLESFGDDCSNSCKAIREDLKKAFKEIESQREKI